ncbi:unnamed protein product [Prorocentrum cordatum]|uniref:Uncharacterized protein n=1 Tax=Prorocentrum cordatum TaxID=2364126 RepID=A0ABN9SI14_9DINO|nr:unnamed protein product [Polarella glacialis]
MLRQRARRSNELFERGYMRDLSGRGAPRALGGAASARSLSDRLTPRQQQQLGVLRRRLEASLLPGAAASPERSAVIAPPSGAARPLPAGAPPEGRRSARAAVPPQGAGGPAAGTPGGSGRPDAQELLLHTSSTQGESHFAGASSRPVRADADSPFPLLSAASPPFALRAAEQPRLSQLDVLHVQRSCPLAAEAPLAILLPSGAALGSGRPQAALEATLPERPPQAEPALAPWMPGGPMAPAAARASGRGSVGAWPLEAPADPRRRLRAVTEAIHQLLGPDLCAHGRGLPPRGGPPPPAAAAAPRGAAVLRSCKAAVISQADALADAVLQHVLGDTVGALNGLPGLGLRPSSGPGTPRPRAPERAAGGGGLAQRAARDAAAELVELEESLARCYSASAGSGPPRPAGAGGAVARRAGSEGGGRPAAPEEGLARCRWAVVAAGAGGAGAQRAGPREEEGRRARCRGEAGGGCSRGQHRGGRWPWGEEAPELWPAALPAERVRQLERYRTRFAHHCVATRESGIDRGWPGDAASTATWVIWPYLADSIAMAAVEGAIEDVHAALERHVDEMVSREIGAVI